MSYDEQEYAREEYESEIASRALCEHGLTHVLENQFDDVIDAVEESQAAEWLEKSCDWLQFVNIVSQHDREKLRSAIRTRAYGGNPEEVAASTESLLFNVASDISKLLESLAKPYMPGGPTASADETIKTQGPTDSSWYGYRLGTPAPPLARYAQHCALTEDLSWVFDLVKLTRAFRDVLFLIGDSQRRVSLHWDLSDHIRTIDAALEKATRPKLVYRGFEGKRHNFGREPDPTTTPLSGLLAEWICEYLTNFSGRIDLGACVECGKIFSRQRSDNAYCSKTCQNRVAYKRRKIFEGGLLRKIDVTPKTASDKLQPGVWAHHPRLGLGLVESVTKARGSLSSINVLFPQVPRTFYGRDLFQSDPDPRSESATVEFYAETDAATLAELL